MGIFAGQFKEDVKKRKEDKDNIKKLYDSIKEQDSCANSLNMITNSIDEDDSSKGCIRYEIEKAARIINFKTADDMSKFVESVEDYGPIAIRTNFINTFRLDAYTVFVSRDLSEVARKKDISIDNLLERALDILVRAKEEDEEEKKKQEAVEEATRNLEDFNKKVNGSNKTY